MRKFYMTCIAALLFALNGMAGDVVTFEEFEVNTDGYQNDFGEDACFESGGFTFYCNYFPEWSYWSGFAISNRTETSFSSYQIDQFNSAVGHGANGSEKFVVSYPQGELIEADAAEGEEISGFYVTNNAWVVDAILNGDGMTPGAFTTGDYLALKIIGNHPDETADTLTFYLADYRSENEADHYYLNDWKWVDLSSLGKVASITFRMESSRSNDWGMTTPGYFCMDDFNGVAPAANDVVTFEEFEVNTDGYQNDFGEDACFASKGFTFYCNYFPEWYYWSGFAISSRTETSFSSYQIDQFNSAVGHGANGSEKFVVAYPQGELIETNAPEGREITGFYVTNNAWVVDAILNGDGMTPGAFTTGDYLALKIIGNHADQTADTLTFYLADYRSENEADHYYLKDWEWVDLSSLGKVTSITFRMESSRANDWGMTTPAYFCMDDFNGVAPAASGMATFEEIALEPESSYNGAGVEGETFTDLYGSESIKSQFTSGAYRFTTVYTPAWGSWSGFGVSNETSTAYATYADQFRCAVGHGYDNSPNYAVVYPSGNNETVEPVDGPAVVSGMYVTNSAWNVYAYTVGDGMTPGAFATGDWCKLTATGTHADGTTATVEVYLADYRSANEADHYYIDYWQWVDLSGLGEVSSITFAISSSRANDWGMTTPGYFCMDNFGGQPDETVGISHNLTTTQNTCTVSRHTIDGKAISAPQRGINIVRMGDGTTRKVIVR